MASSPEPETNAEPESTHEPNSESEPGPVPEGIAVNAEPVPEWPASHEIWGAAWELHWIGLGILFFCVAIWSAIALLHMRKRKLLATRRFCYAVKFLLIVFGVTRGLAMFLYPYEMVANAHGTPVILQRLLFGIGFPCITAGYTLIHFAFLEAAKMSHLKRRIQSLRFIIGVIVAHFLLEIVSEVTTSYVGDTSYLLIACLLYFVLFSLVISVSVLYSGLKVIRRSQTNRRTMRRISRRDGHSTKGAEKGNKYCNRESNTTKVAYVTIVTAVLGLACAAAQLYAMICVFQVGSSPKHPKAWPWWSYQTVSRIIEAAMASTMVYTISHPKKGGYFKGCFWKRKRTKDAIVLTNSSVSDGVTTKPSTVSKSPIIANPEDNHV